MMRAVLTCAATAAVVGVSALTAGAQTPPEINFGVLSTEASMNQKKNWKRKCLARKKRLQSFSEKQPYGSMDWTKSRN